MLPESQLEHPTQVFSVYSDWSESEYSCFRTSIAPPAEPLTVRHLFWVLLELLVLFRPCSQKNAQIRQALSDKLTLQEIESLPVHRIDDDTRSFTLN